MLTKDERFKLRLRKDRPKTAITLNLPSDVIQMLDEFAPYLGVEDHRTLILISISEGVRKFEAQVEAILEEQRLAAPPATEELTKQAS